MMVAKRNVIMHVIADRLDSAPACDIIAEELPGRIDQGVRFAVPAAEQKQQCLVRELFNYGLPCLRIHTIGQPAIIDDGIRGKT